ncbi:MAG: hypothetical protein ABUT20_62750, partial [Bacteroidota bacterium]
LGLIAAIIYYGFVSNSSWKLQLKQSVILISGFIVTTGIVVAVMKSIGHFDLYVNSLKIVFNMAKEAPESRGKGVSSYNTSRLIELLAKGNLKSLVFGIGVIAFSVGLLLANEFFERKSYYRKWIAYTLLYALMALFCIWCIKDNPANYKLLFVFVGITLATGLFMFTKKSNPDVNTLMFIGCFVVLVFPVGSSEGIFMVGPYSLWIGFPIAVDYLCNIKSINTHLHFSDKERGFSGIISLNRSQLSEAKKYLMLVFTVVSLYYAYNYPFFDRENRIRMHTAIENKYLKGIYTSKARAEVINSLLTETKKYVKKDDYLLSYYCTPMFNYLTETKPYIRNSFPWLYAPGVFKKELDLAVSRTGQLPVVIAQNIKTVGDCSDWPQTPVKVDSEWEKANEPRDNYFNEFLKEYNYREVYNNGIFKILTPERSTLITKNY